MTQAQGDPRQAACPACNAQPGAPCNVPTNTGRRDVAWFHLTREAVATR